MPLFPEGRGTKSRPIKTISCTPRRFYYGSRIFSLLQVNVSRTIGILHARWNAFHFKSHHFYWHSPKLEDHTHKQNHFWSSHHVKVLDKRQTLFSVPNNTTLDSLLKLQTRKLGLMVTSKRSSNAEQNRNIPCCDISHWHVQHLIVMYRFPSVTQAKRTWIGRSKTGRINSIKIVSRTE